MSKTPNSKITSSRQKSGRQLFQTEPEIKSWLLDFGIPEEKIKIQSDLSVDIDWDVLITKRTAYLPVNFNHVAGDFNCIRQGLKSLEGSPQTVGGDFYCYQNKLKSLVGGPRSVGKDFSCTDNQLTNLLGAPEIVKGGFSCANNKIVSLVGAPKGVSSFFYCSDNLLANLVGGPEYVGGFFNCAGNQLTSFTGLPELVQGGIDVHWNVPLENAQFMTNFNDIRNYHKDWLIKEEKSMLDAKISTQNSSTKSNSVLKI